jgi:hypothetical protein
MKGCVGKRERKKGKKKLGEELAEGEGGKGKRLE